MLDPVQVVCHLGVDPRLVGPATAVPPGDDAQESAPVPAGADHRAPAVPLAAVDAAGQVAGTEHARGQLVLAVHLTLHTAPGLQYRDGGRLEPPGVSSTGLAGAAPARDGALPPWRVGGGGTGQAGRHHPARQSDRPLHCQHGEVVVEVGADIVLRVEVNRLNTEEREVRGARRDNLHQIDITYVQ